MTSPGRQREPWHYDAVAGRPGWSKQLARLNVIQRAQQRLIDRHVERDERSRKKSCE